VDDSILKLDLSKITWLFINSVEGEALSGTSDYPEIIQELHRRFPDINVLLTLGEKGVMCYCNGEVTTQEIFKVPVVDTTAAGDTFTGYFISGLVNRKPIKEILKTASAASAISVSRHGASTSIPTAKEVEQFLKGQ
jgi:ribokinase